MCMNVYCVMYFAKETRWFYLNGIMKEVLIIPI